jgi:hypothetical protein
MNAVTLAARSESPKELGTMESDRAARSEYESFADTPPGCGTSGARPIFIVGGGSFAVKLSAILEQHGIWHQFLDRFRTEPLRGRTVHRLDAVAAKGGIYLVAIQLHDIAREVGAQLQAQGMNPLHVLLLLEESSANALACMLSHDKVRTLNLLNEGNIDFPDLERKFYPRQYEQLSVSSQTKKIGFCFIGGSGGFRRHVRDLPYRLRGKYSVKTFSDQFSTKADIVDGYTLMSELSMLRNEWPDFVINPHFFECSPAHTPKLTMMHMVYDFLVYRDLVARVMGQPDTHYIFIPSVPSMDLHKSICFDYGLKNNIVLIPGGYPRLDENIERYEQIKNFNVDGPVILYAPTLSSVHCTSETAYTYSIYGAVDFITEILSQFPEAKVIFRPHPEDLADVRGGADTDRCHLFRQLLDLCANHPRVELDDDQGDYITTFARSTVMISDTSAIAYSYALTTGKPVIFFSKNDAAVKSIFKDVRYITDREKIGYCVDNTPALIDTLKQCFEGNGLPAVKRDFVTSLVFNRGYSFQYLVNHIDDMIEGRRVEGWWYLRDHL